MYLRVLKQEKNLLFFTFFVWADETSCLVELSMKKMSSGQVTHIPSASSFSCSASLKKINCVWVFEGSHFLDWITASLACKNMTA